MNNFQLHFFLYTVNNFWKSRAIFGILIFFEKCEIFFKICEHLLKLWTFVLNQKIIYKFWIFSKIVKFLKFMNLFL